MAWGLWAIVASTDVTLSIWSSHSRGILSSPFLIFRIFFFSVIAMMIIRYLRYRRYNKNSTKLQAKLRKFEENQRNFILSNLCMNKDFTTLCTECCHFDNKILICSLALQERKVMINLQGFPGRYCLYWNYTEDPFILKSFQTDNISFKL